MEGKITQLTERGTDIPLWPQTIAQGVLMGDGGNAEDAIAAAARQSFDDTFTYLAGANGNIDYSHMESGVLKPYYLNTLWLTYKEAMAVVESAMDFCANPQNTIPEARTNILTWKTNLNFNAAPYNAFSQRPHLEVVRVSADDANQYTGCNIAALAKTRWDSIRDSAGAHVCIPF